MNRPDQQLDEQLHRMATRVRVPQVPVATDLARGRRRLRRTRLLTGGAAAATVLAVAVGAAAAPGVLHADGRPGFSGSGSPDPSSTGPAPTGPSGDATPVRPARVQLTPTHAPPAAPDGASLQDRSATLVAWEGVLAEHLDPRWQHLVKYDARTNGNVQTSTGGDGVVTALGSKYGWRVAGEAGLGMLQVSVDAGWKDLYWDCGRPASGWDCRDARGPHGEQARTARHDGVLDVAVQHDDGEVVVLTADSLFGNNSTVPVSGLDVSEQGLLAAAADDRLALPGGVPRFPPAVGRATLAQAGRDALTGPGESLAVRDGGGGQDPWARADWTGPDGASGGLEWSAVARPVGSRAGEVGPQCRAVAYSRCFLDTVDGRQVFVGRLPARAGGGWQVSYAGPSYTVRVGFTPGSSGASFPLARAEALALDDRLQPVG